MDHSEAVQLNATEKYLLGDLPTDQREAFEEHFFACTECAQDVKAAAILIDNARAVLREAPVPARSSNQPVRKPGWDGFSPLGDWPPLPQYSPSSDIRTWSPFRT